MHIELTDREVGELIGALQIARDHVRAQGLTGNDLQSALNKIYTLMTPSTYGLRIEALS